MYTPLVLRTVAETAHQPRDLQARQAGIARLIPASRVGAVDNAECRSAVAERTAFFRPLSSWSWTSCPDPISRKACIRIHRRPIRGLRSNNILINCLFGMHDRR